MRTDADTLRERLERGAVNVRVKLPSGPCWCALLAVRKVRGGASLAVSASGVLTRVSLDAVLEVSEPPR